MIMKRKNILLSVFTVLTFSAFSQQNITVGQVPPVVKGAFEQLYPNVSNVTWQEESGYYFAVFNVSGAKTKVLLDPKGSRIQTFTKIQSSALPATISSYISTNYSGQTVTDAEQLTMLNNSTRYEAMVGGKDLLFYGNGDFIRVNTGGPIKQ